MSWRYLSHLLLLVGLTLIDPSEEGCLDYFKMDSWTEYASLTDPVDLVMLNNTKDIMECSVERAYLQSLSRTKNLNLFYILKHCFGRSNVSGISEKCRGETSEEILFYHFMCWTAKAVEIDVPPDYCSDYGTLCSIYAEISFPVTIDETTLPPTTTLESTTATLPPTTTLESTTAKLPPTTTLESTTATLPPTTTLESTTATLPPTTNAPTTLSESTTATLQTATTKATTKVAAIGDDGGGDQSTLPPTTNAPTTLSESTTATLPPTTTTTLQTTTTTTKATTKVTAIADAGGRGSQKYNKDSTDTRDTDILNLKILLVISVILNVTVPVIVYLRMRLQKKQQMANGAWIWSDTDPKPNGNVEMVPLQNDA